MNIWAVSHWWFPQTSPTMHLLNSHIHTHTQDTYWGTSLATHILLHLTFCETETWGQSESCCLIEDFGFSHLRSSYSCHFVPCDTPESGQHMHPARQPDAPSTKADDFMPGSYISWGKLRSGFINTSLIYGRTIISDETQHNWKGGCHISFRVIKIILMRKQD